MGVVKTSELSGFNMPISKMQETQSDAAQEVPLVEEDHTLPSIVGKRLRGTILDDQIEGQCENCGSATMELCECFLCERLLCQGCVQRNLCNVCAPTGSWTPRSQLAMKRAVEAARTALEGCRLVEAREQAELAMRMDPQQPEPYSIRAECHRLEGDLGQALYDLTTVVDMSGTGLKGTHALAQRMMLYWNEGETELARTDAATLLAAPEEERGSVRPFGLPQVQATLVRDGAQGCLQLCHSALLTTTDPVERWEMLALRAECSLRLGLWGSAINDACAAASEAFESNLLVRAASSLTQGRALLGLGRYSEALTVLRAAAELGAGTAPLHASIALCLLGRPAEGRQELSALDRRDLQLAMVYWSDVLVERPRDNAACCGLRAALLLDASAAALLPQDRVSGIKRTLKVHALKQGTAEGQESVHHPAACTIRIRLACTGESAIVRLPPGGSVSATTEILRTMSRIETVVDESTLVTAGSALHLMDPATGRWLESHEAVRPSETGTLHLLERPSLGRTRGQEVDLLLAAYQQEISVCLRLHKETAVLDGLYLAAEAFGVVSIFLFFFEMFLYCDVSLFFLI